MAKQQLIYAIDEAVQEHRSLESLCDHLRAILGLHTPDTAGVVMLRWRIGKQLFAHMAHADKRIYGPILQSGDRMLIAAADRVRRERMCVELAYRAYLVEWPLGRINAEWAGFATTTRALMDSMACLLADEESSVFAQAGRLGVPRAA